MPDRAAPAGSAPATEEVEVTPEMIEAGADVLVDQCDLLRPMALSIARAVFQEMNCKKRSSRS